MYRFGAALFALWVTQQEPAPAAAPEHPREAEAQARTPAPDPVAPPPQPLAPAAEPAPPPPSPRPVAPAPAPSVAPASPAPRRGVAAPSPPPALPTRPTPPPVTPAAPPQAPAPLLPPPPVRAAPSTPQPERERALRAALAFVDRLARSDGGGLAALSTEPFSFDGEAVRGRDAQVRRWGEIFAERPPADVELRDLALLTVPEALAQLGAPPPRIAGLLKPGAWIAVADLSGRPVVIVLVQEGGRFAAAGMHD